MKIKIDRLSTVNSQLSTLNSQLSESLTLGGASDLFLKITEKLGLRNLTASEFDREFLSEDDINGRYSADRDVSYYSELR